jgi:short-subunit dehydrogenase
MKRLLLGATLGLLVWAWRKAIRQLDSQPIAHKVVLITGAAQGIGAETARLFAQHGAKVVLLDLHSEALEALQAQLAPLGVETMSISADITFEDSMQQAVARIVEIFGRLDIVVNNAGLILSGALGDYSLERIQRVIDVNLYGTIISTQAALAQMRRQHSGQIINVASASAAIPTPGFSVYGATKSAVLGFSEALRREVAADGISVTCVLPAWARTNMIAHMREKDMQEVGLISPLVNIVTAQEVAHSIVQVAQLPVRSVIVGSLGWKLFAVLQRLSPALVDALFPLLTQPRRILEVVRRLD